MDRRLLKAATSGDAASLKRLASHDPGVLFWTTPPGNTCLHISSIQGHDELCESILAMDQSTRTVRRRCWPLWQGAVRL
jgi:hypothetical protein